MSEEIFWRFRGQHYENKWQYQSSKYVIILSNINVVILNISRTGYASLMQLGNPSEETSVHMWEKVFP